MPDPVEGSDSGGTRFTRTERVGLLAVWVGLGIIESTKAYVERRFFGTPISWASALAGNLPWWLVWAAFTPAAVLLARRVRPAVRSPHTLLLHLFSAIGLSLLHHVIVGTFYYFTNTRGMTVAIRGAPEPITLLLQIRIFFSGYFVLNVLTYLAAVGVVLALEFYKRYRAGELRAVRLEADMHAARMAALRMELNPHFLFNTLNAVTGLIATGGSDPAIRMLARLSELLRATLEGSDDTEIPLERDLDLVSTYLEIEKIRFGDRLTVMIEADRDALEALVPPLLLQPIVENAFRHGISRHEGPARIAIKATAEDGWLDVAVRNTGPQTSQTADTRGRGVGLENTRARLRHFYGPGAILSLRLLPSGEWEARIRAPLKSEEALPATSSVHDRSALVHES